MAVDIIRTSGILYRVLQSEFLLVCVSMMFENVSTHQGNLNGCGCVQLYVTLFKRGVFADLHLYNGGVIFGEEADLVY